MNYYFYETHECNKFDFPDEFNKNFSKYQKLNYRCKNEFEKNMWNENEKNIIRYEDFIIHFFTFPGHHMGERKWRYIRYKNGLFYDKGKICVEYNEKL